MLRLRRLQLDVRRGHAIQRVGLTELAQQLQIRNGDQFVAFDAVKRNARRLRVVC